MDTNAKKLIEKLRVKFPKLLIREPIDRLHKLIPVCKKTDKPGQQPHLDLDWHTQCFEQMVAACDRFLEENN